MYVFVEVSERWLFGAYASAFHAGRPRLATQICDMVGRMAVRAVCSTDVPEIRHIGITRVIRRALPQELETSADIRIIIQPPWHAGPLDSILRYITSIIDNVQLVVNGDLQGRDDNPVITYEVQPVVLCGVTIGADGEHVPGTEYGTLRSVGEPNT